MSSRSGDIVFLLGAGASVEAGIPASAKMIDEIETLLSSDRDWEQFAPLYNHVKSAIHYGAGLKGVFGWEVPFNIETLVNALYELERNEEHPLYPFIASWNSRFVGLAGVGFTKVVEFRQRILQKLKEWVCPEEPSLGDYYRGFVDIQKDLNYPLHVFSLNYDLCMEAIASTEFRVETGFGGHGPSRPWDWERFDHSGDSGNPLPQVFLYKIHGSINWKRDDGNNLYSVEQVQNVDPQAMDIIFGREFKLEAADPYLFYAYQFRRCTLDSKLIVTVGFSFADAHINKMVSQALARNADLRVMVVTRAKNEAERNEKLGDIRDVLKCNNGQVLIEKGAASDFFRDKSVAQRLVDAIPQPKGSPF